MTEQYFGKYRGTVLDNYDPQGLGRIKVSCPAVFGTGLDAWAMPCVPFAGMLEGFHMYPKPTSNVWVEFEQGDPSRPIWTGCFWTQGTLPLEADPLTKRIIKTLNTTVILDDAQGITLEVTAPPMTIKVAPTGIEITAVGSTVKLDPAPPPGRVTINGTGLEVM